MQPGDYRNALYTGYATQPNLITYGTPCRPFVCATGEVIYMILLCELQTYKKNEGTRSSCEKGRRMSKHTVEGVEPRVNVREWREKIVRGTDDETESGKRKRKRPRLREVSRGRNDGGKDGPGMKVQRERSGHVSPLMA
ncbi:uncharacterized protein LOC112493682 [Cephus cinctus]|uniref:Uncharacterized protein LOC112493682 n=1 Tax=Cephus cinctus TaxID=211228 RepID=A0AAJ7R8Q3_CEPCN|nr:uncharacterized protein LOC112493682 [Cephus cinctus]